MPSNVDIFEREERCRKAIKSVVRAIFMRILAAGILVWAALCSGGQIWVIGLMVFVIVITLSGMLPLWQELKKRRKELQEILAEEEK